MVENKRQQDQLIAARKPGEYDRAVDLLTDPETIAERDDRTGAFNTQAQPPPEQARTKDQPDHPF